MSFEHNPVDAERLANGNTLISERPGSRKGRIIEVDSAYNVVWEMTKFNWSLRDVERLEAMNTPPGDNVDVVLEDPETGGTPITLEFARVTEGGVTTLAITSPEETGVLPPLGYKLCIPTCPEYYVINTTAGYFDGGIQICFDLTHGKFVSIDNLKIFYLIDETSWEWVEIPWTDFVPGEIICCTATSLGTFPIVEPDNRPPVALCQNVVVSAGSDCTADASIDNGSYDMDGDPITFTQDPPGPYQLGDTLVTLTVEDGKGGTDICVAVVTVNDTTPPTINSITANPNSLWPANHKMVPITLTVSTSDNCDPEPNSQIIEVTSNEPVNGKGDGNTVPDWEVTGDLALNLRAERSGNGSGRIYTITVRSTDNKGNSSDVQIYVTVPHDKKKKK